MHPIQFLRKVALSLKIWSHLLYKEILGVGKPSMVGKSEVGKTVDSGKLSRESDGLETCSREKDVAPDYSLSICIL